MHATLPGMAPLFASLSCVGINSQVYSLITPATRSCLPNI